MLRLAELAALGYSSGVIVAQMVKVRLIAVVMRLNFYKNIIAGNSGLSKNFLRRLNVIPEDKITLDFMKNF